jgi:hypothetical protein
MREGQLGRILRAYSVPARTRAGWLLRWAHFDGWLAGWELTRFPYTGGIDREGWLWRTLGLGSGLGGLFQHRFLAVILWLSAIIRMSW